MNYPRIVLFCLLSVLSMGLSTVHASDERPGKSSRDAVLIGDALCTKCHDEDEDYPVLAIGKTRHGTVADVRAPTCTSCHGESEEHARARSDRKRPKPEITYRAMDSAVPKADRAEKELGYDLTPVASRNAACLGCHQGGKRMHWTGSTHESRDLACTSCHQVHVEHDRVRDQRTQTEVCFNCHKEQRVQMNRRSHHPVKEGEMACSDCHNVHGSIFPGQLVRDNVNDTCYQCHMEKRGPFVYNHQPVQEDCTICHNPHGSTHEYLLNARTPWLCQQCHEHDGHQGSPGSLTGFASNYTLARGCLNCHTNIHGSNNPADARTFRR